MEQQESDQPLCEALATSSGCRSPASCPRPQCPSCLKRHFEVPGKASHGCNNAQARYIRCQRIRAAGMRRRSFQFETRSQLPCAVASYAELKVSLKTNCFPRLKICGDLRRGGNCFRKNTRSAPATSAEHSTSAIAVRSIRIPVNH